MSETTDSEQTKKKEYGKISLSLVLSKKQIDECSAATVKCKSLEDTVSKVSKVLIANEKAILDQGYEPEQLSHAIATSLFPAIEKLRKEGKID